MPRMTGGQALVKSLHREGVRVMFGLPGVQLYHALDPLYDEPDIRFVNTRHEQATTYMADGYARAGGTVGFDCELHKALLDIGRVAGLLNSRDGGGLGTSDLSMARRQVKVARTGCTSSIRGENM